MTGGHFSYVQVIRGTSEVGKQREVLVNLIGNAKHAMDDGLPSVKQVTLRFAMNRADHFKTAVTDKSIVIPGQNLTRAFAHEFTSKKTGHRFGLHSGALAATEMGRALQVHGGRSEKGATFTLELPLKLEESNG